MTEAEIHHVAQAAAEAAAERAVKKTFAILGVDINKPSEVEDLRATIRHAAFMRQLSTKFSMAFVGAVALGIIVALWTGAQQLLGKH